MDTGWPSWLASVSSRAWRPGPSVFRQMYTALHKRRVEARFVRYPDTYHGNWTPWNTLHRYYQELRFWDEHLAGGS